MIPYPYQLNIRGRHIRGKLYSHTGSCIGRRKTQRNSKNISEIISVCDVHEKIRMAHIHYAIDLPENSTITLFYFRQGRRFRLFQIYVHETDSFHPVSAHVLDDMIAETLRFGILRRLWSDALHYLIWILIILFALIAAFSAYYFGNEGLIVIISTALISVLLLILRGPVMKQLGGIDRMTSAMQEKVIPLCRNLLNSLKKPNKKRQPILKNWLL